MAARTSIERAFLFRGATAADLDAVAALARTVALGVAESVFDADAPGDAFFIIERGSVDLRVKGHEQVLATMTSGQPIGEDAFFDSQGRGKRTGSAVTHEPSQLHRIAYADLERLLAERPSLALVVYRNAATFYAHIVREMATELTHRFI